MVEVEFPEVRGCFELVEELLVRAQNCLLLFDERLEIFVVLFNVDVFGVESDTGQSEIRLV